MAAATGGSQASVRQGADDTAEVLSRDGQLCAHGLLRACAWTITVLDRPTCFPHPAATVHCTLESLLARCRPQIPGNPRFGYPPTRHAAFHPGSPPSPCYLARMHLSPGLVRSHIHASTPPSTFSRVQSHDVEESQNGRARSTAAAEAQRRSAGCQPATAGKRGRERETSSSVAHGIWSNRKAQA